MTTSEKRKYRVTLPIQLGDKEGPTYPPEVVELDAATAKEFSHALIAVEEKEQHAN